MTHPSDLLPTSTLTQDTDDPLESLEDDVRLNDVLLMLAERWLSQSLNPVVFYHGIIDLPADSLEPCGLGYVSGQAAVSNIPNAQCNEYTIAHEFGHNLSLDHSPGCGVADVDPDYPYDDGQIGNENGWVLSTRAYVSEEIGHYDLMGYCNDIGPTFLARYHFAKAAQNTNARKGRTTASFASTQILEPEPAGIELPKKNLVVTGKVDRYGNFELFSMSLSDLTSHDNNGDSKGSFNFVISDSMTGELLTAKRFQLKEISHSDETHWYLSIPLPELPLLTDISVRDQRGDRYLHENLSEKIEILRKNEIYMHRKR